MESGASTVTASRGRAWKSAEIKKLMWSAGICPVQTLCRQLERTERSVRCKLHRLGLSARVKEGWSVRELRDTYGLTRRQIWRAVCSGRFRIHTALISASKPSLIALKLRLPVDTVVVLARYPLEWIAHSIHRSRRDVFRRVCHHWRIDQLRVTDDSVEQCRLVPIVNALQRKGPTSMTSVPIVHPIIDLRLKRHATRTIGWSALWDPGRQTMNAQPAPFHILWPH